MSFAKVGDSVGDEWFRKLNQFFAETIKTLLMDPKTKSWLMEIENKKYIITSKL